MSSGVFRVELCSRSCWHRVWAVVVLVLGVVRTFVVVLSWDRDGILGCHVKGPVNANDDGTKNRERSSSRLDIITNGPKNERVWLIWMGLYCCWNHDYDFMMLANFRWLVVDDWRLNYRQGKRIHFVETTISSQQPFFTFMYFLVISRNFVFPLG